MSKGFKLNYKGVGQLMKSAEMQKVLGEYGDAVKRRAGDGYETSAHVGKTRANVSVSAKTREARKDNLKNNTLLKAVRG